MKVFTALVLAGSRNSSGEGLNTATQLKATMPVFGVPMIERVVTSLKAAHCVKNIIVCGPETLGQWPDVTFVPAAGSPAASLSGFLENRQDSFPLLVTTADHPLLTPEMIDHFCRQTLRQDADLTVGMASKAIIESAYKRTRRTFFRFRDGDWCGCNLYGATSGKVLEIVRFWREVENHRKRPGKVIAAFGLVNLIGVLLKRWSIAEAFGRAGARFGVNTAPVIMPWPEASIDVDSLSDLELAETILATRTDAKPHLAV